MNETTIWICRIMTFVSIMFVRGYVKAGWCRSLLKKLLAIFSRVISECCGTEPISLRKMLQARIGLNLGNYPNWDAEFHCARQEDSAFSDFFFVRLFGNGMTFFCTVLCVIVKCSYCVYMLCKCWNRAGDSCTWSILFGFL